MHQPPDLPAMHCARIAGAQNETTTEVSVMSILYDGKAQECPKLAQCHFSFLKPADMYVFHVERLGMLVPQAKYRVVR